MLAFAAICDKALVGEREKKERKEEGRSAGAQSRGRRVPCPASQPKGRESGKSRHSMPQPPWICHPSVKLRPSIMAAE
jgi:hypothetical protein